MDYEWNTVTTEAKKYRTKYKRRLRILYKRVEDYESKLAKLREEIEGVEDELYNVEVMISGKI